MDQIGAINVTLTGAVPFVKSTTHMTLEESTGSDPPASATSLPGLLPVSASKPLLHC
jgi:hypothetical protein